MTSSDRVPPIPRRGLEQGNPCLASAAVIGTIFDCFSSRVAALLDPVEAWRRA